MVNLYFSKHFKNANRKNSDHDDDARMKSSKMNWKLQFLLSGKLLNARSGNFIMKLWFTLVNFLQKGFFRNYIGTNVLNVTKILNDLENDWCFGYSFTLRHYHIVFNTAKFKLLTLKIMKILRNAIKCQFRALWYWFFISG